MEMHGLSVEAVVSIVVVAKVDNNSSARNNLELGFGYLIQPYCPQHHGGDEQIIAKQTQVGTRAPWVANFTTNVDSSSSNSHTTKQE